MDRMMIIVDFQLPRKTKTTSVTMMKVMMMVSTRVLMESMISVEPSYTVVISMSEGRVSSISASLSLTPLITFTVLAPDCFWMMIRAERSPLV